MLEEINTILFCPKDNSSTKPREITSNTASTCCFLLSTLRNDFRSTTQVYIFF